MNEERFPSGCHCVPPLRPQVVNIPNSMTVLDEMLPISVEMGKRGLTGIWNFTNPGVVSHNEVLQLYKDYIDPSFTWQNFTLEEQVSQRSLPCVLQCFQASAADRLHCSGASSAVSASLLVCGWRCRVL